MWDTSGAKHKHIFYNVSRHSKKSGDKLKKAINRYVSLLKREAKAATKWIYKTKIKADARIKKFGITKTMIQKALEKKGLTDLIK